MIYNESCESLEQIHTYINLFSPDPKVFLCKWLVEISRVAYCKTESMSHPLTGHSVGGGSIHS